MTTKLPTDPRSMIRDADLAREVELMLKPYNGKRLELAQKAVRDVRSSGAVGTFTEMLGYYRTAITRAVGKSDD